MAQKTRIRKRRKHKYNSLYKYYDKKMLQRIKWIAIKIKESYKE